MSSGAQTGKTIRNVHEAQIPFSYVGFENFFFQMF